MAAVNVLTPYGAGLLQNTIAALTLYVGTGSGVANGLLTEFTDSAYARQPVTLVANGAQSSNAAGVTFGPAGPSGWAVQAIALFDAATAGDCIMLGALDAPYVVASGGFLTYAAGTLIFAFNTPA